MTKRSLGSHREPATDGKRNGLRQNPYIRIELTGHGRPIAAGGSETELRRGRFRVRLLRTGPIHHGINPVPTKFGVTIVQVTNVS